MQCTHWTWRFLASWAQTLPLSIVRHVWMSLTIPVVEDKIARWNIKTTDAQTLFSMGPVHSQYLDDDMMTRAAVSTLGNTSQVLNRNE